MENKKNVTQLHEMFFKKEFGKKEVMIDFLKYNLPADTFKNINKESLHLTDKSFVHALEMEGESDLVFQAEMQNQAVYIYVLLTNKNQ